MGGSREELVEGATPREGNMNVNTPNWTADSKKLQRKEEAPSFFGQQIRKLPGYKKEDAHIDAKMERKCLHKEEGRSVFSGTTWAPAPRAVTGTPRVSTSSLGMSVSKRARVGPSFCLWAQARWIPRPWILPWSPHC